MKQWHWLTTAPSGRAHTHGADDGQTGWRLHAVWADGRTTLVALGRQPAACGTRPGTGWGLDMFIERKCARCEKALAKDRDHIPPDVTLASDNNNGGVE